MRKCLGMAGLVLSVIWAAPLYAQTGGFLGSFNRQRIENKPIDTSHSLAPVPKPPAAKFNLKNLFKFRSSDFNRTSATTPLVPTGTLPSIKNTNSLQPLPPVIPK